MYTTYNSKIVDFYFTNSLEELNLAKDALEENGIPHEIVRNNNRHPYFGFNSALGVEKNLYNYIIRIPEIFIDDAESIISKALSEEEIITTDNDEEEKVKSQKYLSSLLILIAILVLLGKIFDIFR